MRDFAGNSTKTWPAIALVCVAQFVVVLDVTIVTMALPAIRPALRFSEAGQQWIFTAYALAFGELLICGGRLADVFGRRRIFLIGLACSRWLQLAALSRDMPRYSSLRE